MRERMPSRARQLDEDPQLVEADPFDRARGRAQVAKRGAEAAETAEDASAVGVRSAEPASPGPSTGGVKASTVARKIHRTPAPGAEADPAQTQFFNDKWVEAKQTILAGGVPAVTNLPPDPNNRVGCNRLAAIYEDETIPPDLKAEFLATFKAKITALATPPGQGGAKSLFDVLASVMWDNPDKYNRRGIQPTQGQVEERMGTLVRIMAVQGLIANKKVKKSWYDRMRVAHPDLELPAWGTKGPRDDTEPVYRPTAQKLAERITAADFDPNTDLESGEFLSGKSAGASGWYFGKKEMGENMSAQEIVTRLALEGDYALGFVQFEVSPEQAAGTPDTAGRSAGPKRPTAIDLLMSDVGGALGAEGDPFGVTNPGHGQPGLTELVMPPINVGSVTSRQFHKP